MGAILMAAEIIHRGVGAFVIQQIIAHDILKAWEAHDSTQAKR
jgi:hypothetical protein